MPRASGPLEPEIDSTELRVSPALLTIFSVTLIAVLGVSSIAPALPSVAAALEVGAHEIAWLITAFTLPGVLLAPGLGVLADRWGRRAVLAPALVVFAVAGTACAMVHDLRALVVLRFVQGVGAAPLGSLNVTLIGDLFQGRQRASAMGVNAAVLSVGTAGYPLVGGLLAGNDWRLPFVLPSVALLVAPLVWRCFPPHARNDAGGLGDYFVRVRAHLDAHLLALMAASLLTFVILYGSYLTYLPFLMHERLDSSPRTIGLVLSSASVATALASLRVAALVTRWGAREVLLIAYSLYVVSMLLIATIVHPVAIVIAALLFGAGNGLNVPTLQSWMAGAVPTPVRAGVMSLNAMALRLGQTLGPLAAGLAYTIGGLEAAFLAGALTGLLLVALALVALRH